MTKAFVFPGQGSQAVGMGKALADAFDVARHTFEEVDDALGQKLTNLMFEGPIDELTLTENTQPALMAVSMAAMRVLEKEGNLKLADIASYVAGHSLGEYSALTAAGALTVSDAAKLLKLRGQSMQKAVPVGVGAMAAVLGLDFEDVVALVEQAKGDDVLAAANDNANGQVVISGHVAAVERAIELAKEKGAKRSVLLPVSAPFHCPLMAPAAEAMAAALAETNVKAPSVPVIANVLADQTSDPAQIKEVLVEQVTGSVRWRESVLKMKELGVETLVEVGAGKVLTGLTRRIERSLGGVSIQTPEDIETFLKSL